MKLEIPPGEFAGYIFDLDGTLVDTMPLHYRAWNETLRRAGLREDLNEDIFYSLGGVPTRRVAELLGQHYRLPLNPERIFEEKEVLFSGIQHEAQLIMPVVEFARKMAKTHPLAIASGGPRPIVRRTLELGGLASLFRVVVTPEDVARGKPAPDMFLLAARRLGVAPERCLVLEDAEPGVQAARAAGMTVLLVASRGLAKTGASRESSRDITEVRGLGSAWSGPN
ncbi:MAG: HAD-IA family hydrolase [Opitutaceae bacterium]|nr:HAD-IA family hydrolase [Opitutaceae bacterium]